MAWAPREGSAVLVQTGLKKHLFAVLNDPMQLNGYGKQPQICMVSFTTVYPNIFHDPTCVFQAQEHPFITHESYVAYMLARVVSERDWTTLVQQAMFVPHRDDFTKTQIRRIKTGLYSSPHTPHEFTTFGL
jgi:hypothetical protein